MASDDNSTGDVEQKYQQRRLREWTIFVVGGFIGSSFTYYLGPPVLWVLSVLLLIALFVPFLFGDEWTSILEG